MQVRARFVVSLAVTLIAVTGGSAYASHERHVDRQNLRQVQALAGLVAAPTDASVSTECHSDGTTACWVTKQTPKQVVAAVASQLRSASADPKVSCSSIPFKVEPTGQLETCAVIVRAGGHLVSVDAYHAIGEKDGKLVIVGTLVGVSAV